MPFELECVVGVARRAGKAPPDVQDAFWRTVARIGKNPTMGVPILKYNVPGILNVRKVRFEFGTLVYRYWWDEQDAAPQILVTEWKQEDTS